MGRLAIWGEVRAASSACVLVPNQRVSECHGRALGCRTRAPPCLHDLGQKRVGKEAQMKCKRWDARLPGVVAMALALGCESSAPIAAPSTSRADALSASVGAPTAAAHIGWEIFGSASATAADGLKIIVTGTGTFVAPAGDGGTSSAATGGGNWETRDASNAVTGSGTYQVTGLVRWERALASNPNIPGSTAGLAILRIEYSDVAPARSRSVAGSRGRSRVASRGLRHPRASWTSGTPRYQARMSSTF